MLLNLILCMLVASGQEETVQDVPVETAEPAPAAPAQTEAERSLETLAALQKNRASKEDALRAKRDELARVTDEGERQALQNEIRVQQQELEQIAFDYESIATGIDVREFEVEPPQGFNLQEELQKLVQPIVKELKDATEAPRQIDRLRSQLTYLEGREAAAAEALAGVESLLSSLEEGDPKGLRPGLESTREDWRERIEDIRSQRTVARFNLDKRLAQRRSLVESTKEALATFFRTRGLHLLLAIGTFFLVLLVMRWAYRWVSHLLKRGSHDERAFYSRLLDVLYFLFVGLIALVAAMLVLYAAGDWVLLGLVLIFLLGVAWASKTAVPMFVEQIRLLLNLGAVRERERVIFEGVPYRVSKLSFYTLLSNSELAGGVRRLPLQDLIDMRSRTCSKDEVWFPCRRGDWVLLSDGKRGKVLHQSPDTVQIEPLGGSRVTYPTGDFLGLAPQNLSHGFRLSVRFGIDYAHQAIATTEVPRVFAARVRAGLEEQFGEGTIRAFRVEFVEAGASSLDYVVIMDVAGDAAPHYDAMQRAVQRLCVDTCNELGWGIPFTQITLHQA